MENPSPKIGVGVIIMRDGKILLGERKNAHGAGEWAPPGGHFEYMESFLDCAKRETKEETGLKVKSIKFLRLFNEKAHAPKHYINLAFLAEVEAGEPQVMEPEKCERWEWFGLDNLPQPLFSVVPSIVETLKTGRNFFDA